MSFSPYGYKLSLVSVNYFCSIISYSISDSFFLKYLFLVRQVAEAVAEVNHNRKTLLKYWERTGCLLTADGSLDDRVHLHSTAVALGVLPSGVAAEPAVEQKGNPAASGLGLGGGPYTYMYAPPADDGKEEKKEEKEGKRGEEVKKEEDPDNVKHDHDEPDLDEEDDEDAQLREASLRDALPDGWQVRQEAPLSLDQGLVALMVAFRWSVTGWGLAKVHRHYARAKGANGFNYQLQYTIGGESVDHRLRVADYSCSDDAPVGAWCVVEQRGVPLRAAAAAAAPAPPPA